MCLPVSFLTSLRYHTLENEYKYEAKQTILHQFLLETMAAALKLICIFLVFMALQDFGTEAAGRGDRCKRDSDCDGDLNCCGFPLKRCWDCCRNTQCEQGEKCK